MLGGQCSRARLLGKLLRTSWSVQTDYSHDQFPYLSPLEILSRKLPYRVSYRLSHVLCKGYLTGFHKACKTPFMQA
jgi:hypothetical protein